MRAWSSRLVLTLVLGSLSMAHGRAACAQPEPEVACDATCWGQAVSAYLADPRHERRSLLALERYGTEGLPPATLLVLADAHLRSGHDHAAAQLFERVAASEPAEPLLGWARLGSAWMAARAGDADRAVAILDDAQSGDHFDPAVVLLLAFLEVSRGDPTGTARLQTLLDDPRATRDVRSAARMALGLAYYWSGRAGRARQEFERVPDEDIGVLDDEARYAVARMTLAEGRTAEAKVLLEQLAGATDEASGASFSRGMLDLERRTLLRKGFTGYRRTPVESPAAQVIRLLDWNGVALARALLARLERDEQGPSDVVVASARLGATGDVPDAPEPFAPAPAQVDDPHAGASAAAPSDPGPATKDPGARAPGSGRFGLGLFALAAIVLTACAVGFVRHGRRTGR